MTGPGVGRGVFAVPVDAVYALAPEAERISDPQESQLPTPITEDTVAGWIDDVSAVVTARLTRLSSLPVGPVRDAYTAAAKTLIACAVASYVEAARYPTGENPYATVLWARYTTGVDAMTAELDALLDEDGGVIVDPGTGVVRQDGPFAAFPWPRFADRIQW